jgi:hypothetical protein
MSLSSPIWLVLLVPWGALVLLLLRGQLHRYPVPFLRLWRSESPQTRPPNRAFDKPPPALLSLLLAILLAILAAAGPTIPAQMEQSQRDSPSVQISRLSVRAIPTTQAMISIINQDDLSSAKLTASADDKQFSADQISLPPRGQTQNYFVDIPVEASEIQIAVHDAGGDAIGVAAKAVRRGSWPIVEATGPLSPALQRMIEVYSRRRPPDESSQRIVVTMAAPGAAPPDPYALVLNPQYADAVLSSSPALTITDSSLTHSVDWNKILAGAKIASPPGRNWQPLILVGSAAVLAQRLQPLRELWVGFDSDNFPRLADFVVFWTSVFDWLGQGGQTYDSILPNPPAPPSLEDSKSLAAPMLLASIGLICFSAAIWTRAARPRSNSPKS